jgi:hypothetical protein
LRHPPDKAGGSGGPMSILVRRERFCHFKRAVLGCQLVV